MTLTENMINRALMRTAGNARINIWIDCFLKMYQSELKELSKMRGGRKMSKIPLGSMDDICLIELPTMPRLYEK